MEPKRILYPLLLLTCIQLSVVIAAFRNSKQTFVANVAHQQIKRKLSGRHKSSIATLYSRGHDNNEGTQKRGAKLGRDTFVAGDHKQIQRKMNGRLKSQHNTMGIEGGADTSNTRPIKQTKKEPVPTTTSVPPVSDSPKTTIESPKRGPGNDSKSDMNGGGWGKNFNPLPANFVDTKTAFFILMGVTVLVIGCFVFRIVRSRSRRKTKKYGILATRGSEVELTPLDQEEEDEDMTVFDANSK